MEMDQWLRCNSCFSLQDKSKNCPFWLTSCGHMFCNRCISTAGSCCLYCSQPNISSMPLMDSASPQVKYIFKPLEDSFEKLRLAFVFQRTQSQINHQRLADLEKTYAFMATEYIRCSQENQSLRAELRLTHEQLDKFRKCFIAGAIVGASPSTSAMSDSTVPSEIQRHLVFYSPPNPVVQVEVEEEPTVQVQTPAKQRIHGFRKAPVVLKKQKAKKRTDQVDKK